MDSPEHEKQFIVDYMASQADDENVEHLEKVASESVFGQQHDVWDVHTSDRRWWVITGPTNLYPQEQFPSMDVALSFHIGLVARAMARSEFAIPSEEAERFAGAWRRWQQAGEALQNAQEAEEFQAVGMRCREGLIAFIKEASSTVSLPEGTARPKGADYVSWSELITDTIAPGSSAERRRGYLKAISKSTWELVNWLTHAGNATRLDAQIALNATEQALYLFSMSFMRFERGDPHRCPECGSYKIADVREYEEPGQSVRVVSCGACGFEYESGVPAKKEPTISDNLKDKTQQDLGDCVFVEVPLRGPRAPKPSTDQ